MACKHRFINQLLPEWKIEHLFIGTFNPSWNYNNAEEADYFYGRSRNNFWRLIPYVFGGENLKHQSTQNKIEYITSNKIGITDLISSVVNAQENNQEDINNMTIGFSDNILNTYELNFNTNNIIDIINQNINSLKGVYLTRSTLNGIHQIRNEWLIIENYCIDNKIDTSKLLTPARNFSNRKILDWQNKITL